MPRPAKGPPPEYASVDGRLVTMHRKAAVAAGMRILMSAEAAAAPDGGEAQCS